MVVVHNETMTRQMAVNKSAGHKSPTEKGRAKRSEQEPRTPESERRKESKQLPEPGTLKGNPTIEPYSTL